MSRVLRVLLVGGVAFTAALCLPAGAGEWEEVRSIQGFVVEHKKLDRSRFPQVRVQSVIPAATVEVYRVISGYDRFSEFVPYVRDSRTVARRENGRLVFQRLHFPGPLADRRYVMLASTQRDIYGRGSFREEWALLEKQDVVDELTGLVPRSFSGFWDLKPLREGTATQATYSIHLDPGGYWPAWLITPAVNRYLPQVMLAVMERVQAVDEE